MPESDDDDHCVWWDVRSRPPPRIAVQSPHLGFSLVFPSEKSRSFQQQRCVDKIQESCLRGLRMGCSIKAAQQRKKVRWHHVFKFLTSGKVFNVKNQGQTMSEEDYFTLCVSEGTEACEMHANSFCSKKFQ